MRSWTFNCSLQRNLAFGLWHLAGNRVNFTCQDDVLSAPKPVVVVPVIGVVPVAVGGAQVVVVVVPRAASKNALFYRIPHPDQNFPVKTLL